MLPAGNPPVSARSMSLPEKGNRVGHALPDIARRRGFAVAEHARCRAEPLCETTGAQSHENAAAASCSLRMGSCAAGKL